MTVTAGTYYGNSMETEKAVGHKRIAFKAADGHALSGSLFTCSQPSETCILICGATGIRQEFYRRIATYFASRGATVLTFDYRGIGRSKERESLRSSKARKQDWGQLDMPAALDTLKSFASSQKIVILGHSAGAQLVGLMPNFREVTAFVMIAPSTGYVRQFAPKLRLTGALLLHAYIPLTARLFGYVPAKAIGWGEDLPPGVALQWAKWCKKPGYVTNSFGTEIDQHWYHEIVAPILAITSADDPIATPPNVKAMLDMFQNSPKMEWTIARREGEPIIGHVGFFRAGMETEWNRVHAWLNQTVYGEPETASLDSQRMAISPAT